jgi:hypothetical protein
MLAALMPLIYVIMLAISCVILYGIAEATSSINFDIGIIGIVIFAIYWLLIQPSIITRYIYFNVILPLYNKYATPQNIQNLYNKLLYGSISAISIMLYVYLVIKIG